MRSKLEANAIIQTRCVIAIVFKSLTEALNNIIDRVPIDYIIRYCNRNLDSIYFRWLTRYQLLTVKTFFDLCNISHRFMYFNYVHIIWIFSVNSLPLMVFAFLFRLLYITTITFFGFSVNSKR